MREDPGPMALPENIDINKSLIPRLGTLTAASFALGTEAYVYVGHLDALVRDLDVSIAAGGSLAAAFALTYALTGPPLAAVAARVDRRTLITGGLVSIGLLNLLAAIAPSFAVLILLRVLCGVGAACIGPTASAAAAMLVSPERRGRAMAAVLAGMTLAFILGIPMGSVVGAYGGWRACFAFSGLLALAAAIPARALLPTLPGNGSARLQALAIALQPHVWRTLLLTMLGFAATFTVIAYIGPVAKHVADMEGAEVGGLQSLIGVGSIIGILIGARFADRPEALTMIAASLGVSLIGLGLYSLLPATSLSGTPLVALLSLAMVLGAAALFARTPVIQARLVAGAPENSAVLLALNGSTVFVGQGVGAAIGAITSATLGIGALGAVAALVAALGILATLRLSPRPALFPQPEGEAS
jgi:MFS transporter, DHA1 family, inner membrane transport protein